MVDRIGGGLVKNPGFESHKSLAVLHDLRRGIKFT
jgi:hypothetical protein